MDDNPPITIAPTPMYLILFDQIFQAPSNGLEACSKPLPKMGMPISQLRAPPINIRIAMLRRTIKPTATKAGDISPPKNIILFPFKMAISKTLFNKPVKEISHLNKAPIIIPLIILFACFVSPVSCPASKTEAQAIPSGYLRLFSSEIMKTCD